MTSAVLPQQVSPPEFALSALPPAEIGGVDVVALPVLVVGDDVVLGPGAAGTAEALDLDLMAIAESRRHTGKVGEIVEIAVPAGVAANPDLRLVLLVGVGQARPIDLRRAGAALARAARDRDAVATTIGALLPDEFDFADPTAAPSAEEGAVRNAIEAFVAGAMLGSFAFHWRSEGPQHQPVRRVVLAGSATTDQEAIQRAVAIGGAGWTSRFLASVPSNLKNPQWLAEQAELIADRHDLSIRVWNETQLAEEGFGGIVGVGKASATPPRLIRLDYVPPGVSARAAKKLPLIALVGKGITFDSGGLSIKPAQSMASMKRDMTGGAVVLATVAALADVGCPVRVTALISAAENAVSGNALRPGDVITHWGGATSEVTNTDAEGRLVMADALAYAAAELDPAVMVDVATLTGAVKVALGQQVGGLFANRDALAERLIQAGQVAGEPVWRMPLYAGYKETLKSKVADLDNAPGGGGGAITAALFLQHFVGDVPWAHLDIASVGDAEKDWHEWTAGPTGFGPRLLLHWLGSEDPLLGLTG